jgi:hypothetical protein
VGDWKETPAYECCNYTPTPETPALRFSSDIAPGGEQGCFSLRAINDEGEDVGTIIDWGDGTVEIANIPADGSFHTFTHSYLEGSYIATVTFDTPERIIVLYINCNAA